MKSKKIWKTIAVFAFAVVLSVVAGMYRWGDSAHSIGLITARGGKARHPVHLKSGNGHYMLISTATVLPPYRGDARVVLEGMPEIDYNLYFSRPVIDLGISAFPRFRDGVLYDLKPKDRLALWVEMTPPEVDPVCGMAVEEDFIRHIHEGKEYSFCNEMCHETFKKDPETYTKDPGLKGEYTLAFYDTRSDKPVLRVPLIFEGKEASSDAGGHHH